MPFIPVPGAVMVRANFAVGTSEQMVNVFHFVNVNDVEVSPSVAEGLAGAIGDAWTNNAMSDVTSDDVALTSFDVKAIDEPDRPSYHFPYSGVGTAAGDPLPRQLALAVTLRTIVGSRGGRGRLFIGGFTEAANDANGLCVAGTRDTVVDWIEACMSLEDVDGTTNADFVLGVVSRHAHVGGDPGGAPIAPVIRPVVSVDANRRFDIQRRRANRIVG